MELTLSIMLTSKVGIIYCRNITSSQIATKPTIQRGSDEGGEGEGEGGDRICQAQWLGGIMGGGNESKLVRER